MPRRSRLGLLVEHLGPLTCGVEAAQYDFVDYSPHAAGRIGLREITDDIVREVLTDPSNRYRSRKHPDRWISERTVPREPTLRVVYVEKQNDRGTGVLVVTLHWIAIKRMGRG